MTYFTNGNFYCIITVIWPLATVIINVARYELINIMKIKSKVPISSKVRIRSKVPVPKIFYVKESTFLFNIVKKYCV